MSAQSQLFGLYPPGSGPEISELIPLSTTFPPYVKVEYPFWELKNDSIPFAIQPIPIHTIPTFQDNLLLGEHPEVCPMNQILLENQKKGKFYNDLMKEFENNTFEELSKILNIDKSSINLGVVSNINDVFMNDLFSNRALPNMSKSLYENITYIYNVNLFYSYYGNELQRRLISTPFIRELLSNFNDKINNKTEKKLIMYSGHDTTLGYLYTALNISNYECLNELWRTNKTNYLNCAKYPRFASNLIIELHEEENNHFVKIRIDGNYVYVCDKLEKDCDWEEFSSRLENFQVKNYEQACQLKKETTNDNESPKNNNENNYLTIIFIQTLLLLFLGVQLFRK